MGTSQSNNRALVELFHKGRRLSYKKGEVIIHSGDVPQGVHLIEKDVVKVYSLTRQGDESVRFIYPVGEVFPLLWAFRGLIRNLYFETLETTVLWRVPREDFLNFANNNLEGAHSVMQHALAQFYVATDRVNNLEYQHGGDRVAYLLLSLGSRLGVRRGQSITINPNVTHQLIADSINLARETVSREIDKLINKGLVSYKGRSIVIKKFDELKRHFEEYDRLNLWNLK